MRRPAILFIAILLSACVSGADRLPSTTAPAPKSPETTATTPETTVTTPETTEPATEATADHLDRLGGEPCPESDFTCVVLEMPLDHFDPANTGTVDVTFAVLPASGESRGAFLTVTGGPGSSGIASADNYASLYDESISETFDLVFFDPRGIAASGGLTCPVAALEYWRSEGDVVTAAGLNQFVAAAETFANDCVAEMGDPELLGYVSTAQVAEDIELLRQEFGWDEFVLFGESYGTQVGQTFAAAHPDSLDRLIIDGVVDLTLESVVYHHQMAEASTRTLNLILEACDEDEWCEYDMATDAASAYDALAAELVEGPITADFPLPDRVEARTFGLGDLETIAGGHLYEEYDRMLFVRALAAYAGDGDLVPLLRLLYINLGIDPSTQELIEDPSWSEAMYYGVECLDYIQVGDSSQEKVDYLIDASGEVEGLRLASVFFGDLPCAFWPHVGDEERPPPLVAEGIPVLVLGSTVDPVTPHHQGVDVHSRLADGHIMSKAGGPHVIFGWGESCPDDDVTAFILDGTPPSADLCDGVVMAAYEPILRGEDFDDPEYLLDAIEWDIFFLPEYYYWDWYTDTAIGCTHGGSMSFVATDTGNDFEFSDCGLAPDVILDGTGSYDSEEDVFSLDVTLNGCAHVYERAGDEYSHESSCA